MKKSLLIWGIPVFVMAMALWLFLTGPVLLRLQFNPLVRDSHGMIFNPFRDRTPERLADQLINQIHSPNCESVLSSLTGVASERATVCAKQVQDPLTNSCTLVDRREYKDASWVSFQCEYQRTTKATSDVSLTFAKHNDRYELQHYERIY